MSEKQTALKAAKALRDKAGWYAGCGRGVSEDELCVAFQAAIDEAEYVNRLVIASQEIDLKERRKQSDALVEALKRLLAHTLSWDRHPDGYACHFCPSGGFPSPIQIEHESKCVIGVARAVLEPFEDRPHKEMRK